MSALREGMYNVLASQELQERHKQMRNLEALTSASASRSSVTVS